MSEELGRIEKPEVEKYKQGRKLYFIPLIYSTSESPAEYIQKFNKYWNEVENQLGELESKLGQIKHIYHELIAASGEDGIKSIKALNEKSSGVTENRLSKGALLEAIEDMDMLTEFMDWSRCLAIGLQNHKVITRVYEAYTEVSKKRNEQIAKNIDQTLKPDEAGILFMRESHHIQFPPDIQIFYIAPPALDEIKRWLRDQAAKTPQEEVPSSEEEEKP